MACTASVSRLTAVRRELPATEPRRLCQVRSPSALVAMTAPRAGEDPQLASARLGLSTRAAPQPPRSQTVMGRLAQDGPINGASRS